jgi:hypothetical protein
MMIVASYALLAATLVALLVVIKRSRWLWSIASGIVGSAVLFAFALYHVDREANRSAAEVSKWQKRAASYCDVLAYSLQAAAQDYRLMTKPGSGYSNSDRVDAEHQYVMLAGERDGFARMCIPDVSESPARQWNECVPHVLNENTLARVEHAAEAIRNHKPCGPMTLQNHASLHAIRDHKACDDHHFSKLDLRDRE